MTRMTHHQSFRVPVHFLFYRGSDVRIVLGLGNDLRYQNDPIGLFMYFAVHHKKKSLLQLWCTTNLNLHKFILIKIESDSFKEFQFLLFVVRCHVVWPERGGGGKEDRNQYGI